MGSETTAGVNSHFALVIEQEILQMLPFLKCVVFSLSLFTLIQLLFSNSVNSDF